MEHTKPSVTSITFGLGQGQTHLFGSLTVLMPAKIIWSFVQCETSVLRKGDRAFLWLFRGQVGQKDPFSIAQAS